MNGPVHKRRDSGVSRFELHLFVMIRLDEIFTFNIQFVRYAIMINTGNISLGYKRQPITWANVDQDGQRCVASRGSSELIFRSLITLIANVFRVHWTYQLRDDSTIVISKRIFHEISTLLLHVATGDNSWSLF